MVSFGGETVRPRTQRVEGWGRLVRCAGTSRFVLDGTRKRDNLLEALPDLDGLLGSQVSLTAYLGFHVHEAGGRLGARNYDASCPHPTELLLDGEVVEERLRAWMDLNFGPGSVEAHLEWALRSVA